MGRIFSFAVVAGLLLGMRSNAGQDELFDGKPLSHWLAALKDSDEQARMQALMALGKAGPKAREAVPLLTKLIRAGKPRIEEQAALALASIGPAASSALPALHERAGVVYNSAYAPAEAASVAFGTIHGWSLAGTTQILKKSVQTQAYFAAKPETTLPHLVTLLQQKDPALELPLLRMIETVASADRHGEIVLDKVPAVRQQLIPLVADIMERTAGKQAAEASVAAFTYLAPAQAERTIAPVVRQLQQGTLYPYEAARLWNMASKASGKELKQLAAPPLVAAFARATPQGMEMLAEYIRPQRVLFQPLLLKALLDELPQLRQGAAMALRPYSTNDRTADVLPALRAALQDPVPAVRLHAAYTLSHWGPQDGKEALPILLDILAKGTDGQRLLACRGLRNLGTSVAVRAQPVLEPVLNAESLPLRLEAAETLLALAPAQTAKAVPALQAVLDTTTETALRERALVLARQLGKDTVALLPQLLALLKKSGSYESEKILPLLGQLGPAAKTAAPLLRERLARGTAFDPRTADVAATLVEIGAPEHALAARVLIGGNIHGGDNLLFGTYLQRYPNETVPEMLKLLHSDDQKLREQALRQLGRLREPPREFMSWPAKPVAFAKLTAAVKATLTPALVKLLDSDERQERRAAVQALAALDVQPPRARMLAVLLAELQAGRLEPYAFGPTLKGQAAQALPALLALRSDKDAPLNERVAQAVRSFGAEALPVLLAELEAADAARRADAARSIGSLASLQETDREKALAALLARRNDTAAAVRLQVGSAVVQLAPGKAEAVVEPLAALLRERELKVRLQAAASLSMLGKLAQPARAALEAALGDDDLAVAVQAALALSQLEGRDAAKMMPVVLRALQADEWGLQASALRIAQRLGSDARNAVPALLKLLPQKQPERTILTAEALVAIEREHANVVAAALLNVLRESHNSMHRKQILSLIQQLGPAAKEAAPLLLSLARERGGYDPFDTAVTLVYLGDEAAAKGMAILRKGLVLNSVEYDCQDVFPHLVKLGPRAKSAVPELRTLLKHKDTEVRRGAVDCLGAIGPEARDALPELQRLQREDAVQGVRRAAEAAVQKIQVPNAGG